MPKGRSKGLFYLDHAERLPKGFSTSTLLKSRLKSFSTSILLEGWSEGFFTSILLEGRSEGFSTSILLIGWSKGLLYPDLAKRSIKGAFLPCSCYAERLIKGAFQALSCCNVDYRGFSTLVLLKGHQGVIYPDLAEKIIKGLFYHNLAESQPKGSSTSILLKRHQRASLP